MHNDVANMVELGKAGAIPRRVVPPVAWLALILAAFLQGICYALVGVNAGLFFGGILFGTLLIAPLALTQERWPGRLIIAMAVNVGIAAVWLAPVWLSTLTIGQWLACFLVLVAWGLAVVGGVSILYGLTGRSAYHFSSAITVCLMLLWLSSPILLARWMPPHPQLTHLLVLVHPLFAINGVVRQFGLWTERPIAYQYLFTLGQDMPLGLPGSILPSVVFHFAVGILGIALSRLRRIRGDI